MFLSWIFETFALFSLPQVLSEDHTAKILRVRKMMPRQHEQEQEIVTKDRERAGPYILQLVRQRNGFTNPEEHEAVRKMFCCEHLSSQKLKVPIVQS